MANIKDATGFVHCPFCQRKEEMHYTVVPPSVRNWGRGKEKWEEFWDESRDYHCYNCDFQFSTLMRPEDYE